MLRHLLSIGVQPEALLLPRRTDQGRCKLGKMDSLLALVEVLIERCNKGLAQHKEVMRHCQL